MPFDAMTPTLAMTKEPSLPLLRDVLRVGEGHPLWPRDFHYEYCDNFTCAMGLAHRLWPEAVREPTVLYMSRAFCIPLMRSAEIFKRMPMYTGRITLAAAITKYLDEL